MDQEYTPQQPAATPSRESASRSEMCQHCGVSNRPWAKMCWMCESPLDGTVKDSAKATSKSHSLNPWASPDFSEETKALGWEWRLVSLLLLMALFAVVFRAPGLAMPLVIVLGIFMQRVKNRSGKEMANEPLPWRILHYANIITGKIVTAILVLCVCLFTACWLVLAGASLANG